MIAEPPVKDDSLELVLLKEMQNEAGCSVTVDRDESRSGCQSGEDLREHILLGVHRDLGCAVEADFADDRR